MYLVFMRNISEKLLIIVLIITVALLGGRNIMQSNKIESLEVRTADLLKMYGGIQNLPVASGKFRELQLHYLNNIMLPFDKFAKEHNIKYWLDYGSLLGAIRHQDFIPWDDDIDISVTEEDFIKLKKAFETDKSTDLGLY